MYPMNFFLLFIQVEGLALRKLADPFEFPIVIHGTYFKNWGLIRDTGLSTMGRTHIHFAIGEVGEAGVISGMRGSAEVIIYIDVPKAMAGEEAFLFIIVS